MTVTEPLTTRQQEIVDYYRLHIAQHGYTPSYRQVGQALGIRSVNGVRQHVLVAIAKGHLKKIVTPRGSVYPVEVTP